MEIVSDSSVGKDRRHLRKAYHDAGVTEYWIVDVRRGPPRFELLLHRPEGYLPSAPDAAGFRRSEVLARNLRFVRSSQRGDLVFFRLEEDGASA